MKKNKLSTPKFSALSIALAIIAIIQIFPLVWLLFFSLKNNAEIFGGNVIGFPHKIMWSNYSAAFTNSKVGIYLINSIIVTAATIIISGFLSCTTAYAIMRMKWKYSKLVLGIILLGLMVPIHATLLPLFIVLRNLKLLNTYLSLIIPYVGFAMPMAVFILTGFLPSIPRELEESAALDGCNIYQIFMIIIMPLLKPAVATISIFTYLSTWNELMFAVTFINKESLKTLTVGIMSMAGQYTTNWGPIGAGLVVATVPTIVIYVLLSNQVQESLTAGALKG